MKSIIVESANPLVLVGGGAANHEDIALARQFSRLFVAADGGAELCLNSGIVPAAVIGDFDSLTPETRARLPEDRLHCIDEQDSTDFDKALRSVRAPILIGVGFLGARVDHQLAALNRLVARHDQPIVLLDREDIVFHCPPALNLSVASGTRVSLFPMGPVTGRSRGLKWPIDGLTLAPDARVGTSNEAVAAVHLEVETPGLLVILPRAEFREALQQVARAAPWPARAR